MRIFLPHSLALSSTVTCAPARFANSAAVSPDAPPPTTKTRRMRARKQQETTKMQPGAATYISVGCPARAAMLDAQGGATACV